MDANHQRLPYDVTEYILDLASDPFLHTTDENAKPKQTLLICTLVCKTWLAYARRRLVSQYMRSGVVKIFPTSQAFLTLKEIFCSPLCTLDPAFIRYLDIVARPYSHKTENSVPFFTLVSTLNEISFPSLNTLRFQNIRPDFDESGDDDISLSSVSSTSPTLPQVKNLAFSVYTYTPLAFEIDAKTTQFFPCLESLTVHGGESGNQRRNASLSFLPPPQSLQSLVVDTATFVGLVEWLTATNHTNISSLSIQDSTDTEEEVVSRLTSGLDTLGNSLEEFKLST